MIHEDNGPVFPVVIFPENIRKIIDTTHGGLALIPGEDDFIVIKRADS